MTTMSLVKVFVKCKVCKERWVEELPYNEMIVGRGHNCEQVDRSRKWIGKEIYNTGRKWTEFGLIVKYFETSRIKHKVGKKGLTKCDGRCMNARGPDCDCMCMGANHGTGHLR